MDQSYDVIVVGGGNAAMCAALSAREKVEKVLVLERAPEEQRGGNSTYTGGGFMMVHHGLKDIQKIVPDLTPDEIANTDFGENSRERYLDGLADVTQYHIDPDLAETLVDNSAGTVEWLKNKGVRFSPMYGRQAYKHNGRFFFYFGLVVAAVGGGRGLIDSQYKIAEKQGITVLYNARAVSLIQGRYGVVQGVRVIIDGEEREIRARAVVLASGGFEANREWRSRHLGPGWDLVKVRGTRYNTGDGIRMALDGGAQPYGQWSNSHACPWERYAPDFGDVNSRANAQRHGYQFAIMVNKDGKRFVDEGADFHGITYAKYGRVILQQPGSFAWQIFDTQGSPYQRDTYKVPGATKIVADSLETLVEKMEDVNPEQFLKTVKEYNASIKRDVPFNPNAKDGRCTVGLEVNKTNWATALEKPPFEAFAVGVGITFTFGGLKIDPTGRVLDQADVPLAGLYAAGELVGGIWHFNYMGGAGLASGAVFGRIAGREAGTFASKA